MKSTFSRVLALTLLVSTTAPIWAQPAAPVAPVAPVAVEEPKSKVTMTSLDALGIIGAFHNKLRRAGTFNGRMIMVKTTRKEGKVVSTKKAEIQSSWIRDETQEIANKKSAFNIVYTALEDGKTTVEKLSGVDDGIKQYRFNQMKNIWSEDEPDDTDSSFSSVLLSLSWLSALASFNEDEPFSIDRKVVNGQDQLVVSTGPDDKPDRWVFDAITGNLLSFTGIGSEETVEVRCLQNDFDTPLADSIFEWKVPEGATKVAPEAMGEVNIKI